MADLLICLIFVGFFGTFGILFVILIAAMAHSKKVDKTHNPKKKRYNFKQQKEIK